MAYNLPPPWDPGFCMPKNVNDEGLERRAFITKWQPRGSYDNPAVGTGGYAVPKYVLDEGYGQGTYTTKWMPSGSYAGPRVPNWLNRRPELVSAKRLPGGGTVATIAPLSDDEAPLPANFEDYGQRAAQILLSRVQAVPPKQRQEVLKQIMNKLDPSLWGRAQEIWRRYIAQGQTPAQALPLAIGRAMSAGLAAEVVGTGLRRSAPQAKSLLGLGCYGCAAILALGADEAADCQTQPGFSWIYGTQGTPGRWERTKAGATDVPFCKTPPAGGSTVDPTKVDSRDHTVPGQFFVGPFPFDDMLASRVWSSSGGGSANVATRGTSPDLMYPSTDPSATTGLSRGSSGVVHFLPINSDVLGWLRDRLTEKTDASGKTDAATTYPKMVSQLGIGGSTDWDKWFSAMGISPDTPIRQHVAWYLMTGIQPLVRTKHPKTGEDMVMHVMVQRVDPTKDWSSSNGLVLKVWLSRVPDPGVLASIWNTLVQIPATVVMPIRNTVVDTVKDLADLACDVLNSTLSGAQGQAAGAAAATAAGVPPQVGAAGAVIAQKSCGQQPPATAPVVPPSSILPYVLLGGGALVALAVLTKKKKKP